MKIQNRVVVDYRKDVYDTTGYLFFPVFSAFGADSGAEGSMILYLVRGTCLRYIGG